MTKVEKSFVLTATMIMKMREDNSRLYLFPKEGIDGGEDVSSGISYYKPDVFEEGSRGRITNRYTASSPSMFSAQSSRRSNLS